MRLWSISQHLGSQKVLIPKIETTDIIFYVLFIFILCVVLD